MKTIDSQLNFINVLLFVFSITYNNEIWQVKLDFLEFDFGDCNICSECDKLSILVDGKQVGMFYIKSFTM